MYDESGEIWSTFGVNSQPSFVFIDAQGNAETRFGAMGEDSISERLDALLAS